MNRRVVIIWRSREGKKDGIRKFGRRARREYEREVRREHKRLPKKDMAEENLEDFNITVAKGQN